jgi:hypothetical protein
MERKARSQKLRSVSKSLGCDQKFSSDQGAVWASIDALHCKAQTNSPTSLTSYWDERKAHETGVVPISSGYTLGFGRGGEERCQAQFL